MNAENEQEKSRARASHGGLALLVLAGAVVSFSADLSSNWKLGSRTQLGPDDWKFFTVIMSQYWLLLLPGSLLSRRAKWFWRVGAVLLGWAIWRVVLATGIAATVVQGGSLLYEVCLVAIWLGSAIFLPRQSDRWLKRSSHQLPR